MHSNSMQESKERIFFDTETFRHVSRGKSREQLPLSAISSRLRHRTILTSFNHFDQFS